MSLGTCKMVWDKKVYGKEIHSKLVISERSSGLRSQELCPACRVRRSREAKIKAGVLSYIMPARGQKRK